MNEIRRASDEIKREITKETRKVEKEMNVEGSVFKDIKKTADEIKQDFDQVTKPFNDNIDHPAGDVPKGTPPPDMIG